jgi:hypothetical protein
MSGTGLAKQATSRPAHGISALFRWKGQALSEVASFVGGDATDDPRRPSDSADSGGEAAAARAIRRILAAADERDPLGLQAQLELAAAVLGLARCLDEVVIPATRQLRGQVTTGPDAAGNVMAIESVRTWLNHRGLFAPAPRPIGPILLACGPRDRQLIGLECLGLLLRLQRWPCRVLGARVPTFTLTVAAQAADAAGVVVMSTESRARQHAVASLHAVDTIGIPVFYAGAAFDTEPSRREVPGQYLGPGVEGACTILVTALGPA